MVVYPSLSPGLVQQLRQPIQGVGVGGVGVGGVGVGGVGSLARTSQAFPGISRPRIGV